MFKLFFFFLKEGCDLGVVNQSYANHGSGRSFYSLTVLVAIGTWKIYTT